MIVQCPACKELVKLQTFSAHNDALVFLCPSCKVRQRVLSSRTSPNEPIAGQPTDAPAPSAAIAPPVMSAPVSVEKPAEPAAPMTARESAPPVVSGPVSVEKPAEPAAPITAPESAPPAAWSAPAPPESLPPVVAGPAPVDVKPGPEAHLWSAWNKLTAEWGRVQAHEAFVSLCAGAGALPFAGLRYRDRLTEKPDDDMAKKGRDRVLTQAMVLATSAKESERPSGALADPRTRKLVTLGVVGLAIIAAMALVRGASRLPSPSGYAGE